MSKKQKILYCLSILFAAIFSIIGIWSNIKAFSIIGSFLCIVILIGYIVYSIKKGWIKHI